MCYCDAHHAQVCSISTRKFCLDLSSSVLVHAVVVGDAVVVGHVYIPNPLEFKTMLLYSLTVALKDIHHVACCYILSWCRR